MTTIIFEDEIPAVKRLTKLIQEYDADIQILKVIDSIEDGLKWLKENEAPDFLFMDIHLSDGNSMGIFKLHPIQAPVIFTTAYDEYAIDAFKVNSVDYLLKPIKKEAFSAAMDKLKNIHLKAAKTSHEIIPLEEPKEFKERFVVKLGNKLIPIETSNIAYFYSKDKISFICDQDGKSFPIDYSLDKIEHMIDPKIFFRVNRQILSSHDAIRDIQIGFKARINLTLFPETNIEASVSSERSSLFKKWIKKEFS
jgi:DNA-binding LytR/AlgR family response regulator